MAKTFPVLDAKHRAFLEKQPIFFIATAAAEGRINLSPKGMDSLRVLAPDRLIWLNLTGSGNETAAHLRLNSRMTLMCCAFEGKPLILRLYGQAKIYHSGEAAFDKFLSSFPDHPGARQIIEMQIDSVQTSCGFAVPFMDFVGERSQLNAWAEKQGEARIRQYWKEKNSHSIDGFDTGMEEVLARPGR